MQRGILQRHRCVRVSAKVTLPHLCLRRKGLIIGLCFLVCSEGGVSNNIADRNRGAACKSYACERLQAAPFCFSACFAEKGMRRKRSRRFEECFLSPGRCVECDFCWNTKHTFPELRIPLSKHSARFRTHLPPPEMLLREIAKIVTC